MPSVVNGLELEETMGGPFRPAIWLRAIPHLDSFVMGHDVGCGIIAMAGNKEHRKDLMHAQRHPT